MGQRFRTELVCVDIYTCLRVEKENSNSYTNIHVHDMRKQSNEKRKKSIIREKTFLFVVGCLFVCFVYPLSLCMIRWKWGWVVIMMLIASPLMWCWLLLLLLLVDRRLLSYRTIIQVDIYACNSHLYNFSSLRPDLNDFPLAHVIGLEVRNSKENKRTTVNQMLVQMLFLHTS